MALGMDHTSINSLNSKRNLKLPPIQGAVPANVYGSKSWNTNRNNSSISHHHQDRTRIRRDLLGTTNFTSSINRVDLNTRVDLPPQKPVITSPRQHVPVKINLGHEFPKTYTVLPPINNKKATTVSRPKRPSVKQNGSSTEFSRIKQEKSSVKIEHNTPPKSSAAHTAAELSARRRQRLQEKLKAESKENISNAENIKKLDDSTSDISKAEQEEESVPRKRSPTYFGHLKCKRFGRRNGVCSENEPTLINVTEQLKEIFLRRNMEEMYLI